MLWKEKIITLETGKLAFKYFNIRECVKGLTTMVPIEEWNNIIITQLEKYEFDESILLSYNRTDQETIYSIYPDLFKETDWFPFASDAAGNFICYDLKKKKCVLYNHETERGEDITQMALEI